MSTIEERVKKIVVEQLGVKEDEVKAESSFVDDLGADSLDTVELVMALEEEFETEIPDEQAEKITTVQQAIDYINANANGELTVELFYADQIVPTGELFRAMQKGTIDCVQSDDDSIAAPVDVSIFGAYFPFASRYSLDVPVLWNWYGLNEIWEEAYSEVKGVTWLSVGAWDPCNFATTKPIRSLADLKGTLALLDPQGKQVDLVQRFAKGRLEQVFIGPKGRSVSHYTLLSGDTRLRVTTRMTGEKLDEPISWTLFYVKQ